MKVIAVFDIGKTNKKLYLFNETFQVIYSTQERWPEITDDDGFPSDDLARITQWMRKCMSNLLLDDRYTIMGVNFSAYGASLVHTGEEGDVVSPFYNYLKPLPVEVREKFFQQYGPPAVFCRDTASPALDLLNSGLQLYFLKYVNPQIFRRIKYSLHLPQYLSFIFSGMPVSDFTSLGCHTAMWHFKQHEYHRWISEEKITPLLAPLAKALWVPSPVNAPGSKVFKIGVGIHDSSAALLPYLMSRQKPFILLSTGTWSIALNPYSQDELSETDLQQDVLNFLRPDGLPVRASRLFLGHIHEDISTKIAGHFQMDLQELKTINFDSELFKGIETKQQNLFPLPSLPYHRSQPAEISWTTFSSPAHAYHQLIWELVLEQVTALWRAAGSTRIEEVFLDGGFTDNPLFKGLLAKALHPLPLWSANLAAGSALGAAMVISDTPLPADYLHQQGVNRVTPLQ